ncbi:MAG: hypothetical protein HOA17_07535, partial [Candidatus Melainabacteria bacterium]|nr:hypothetical protein [Candidatus Melainabacteria bacterium]
GMMHQNIFINSPLFLDDGLRLRITRDSSGSSGSQMQGLRSFDQAELAEPPLFRDAEYASSVQAELIPRNTTEKRNAAGEIQKAQSIYFAGQITGVEGYTESAATGIIAARSILDPESKALSTQTMMGALANYVSHADPKRFQPINSNWGLINNGEPLEKQYRKNKKLRQEFLGNRAIRLIAEQIAENKAVSLV